MKALVTGGADVPEGHYEQDNMKATVVPNRNKIFSSITQAVALSVANKTESQTDIALGIHAGDHAVYPDCRRSSITSRLIPAGSCMNGINEELPNTTT